MKRIGSLVLVTIIVAAFFAFVPSPKGYKVGDVAEGFKLKNVDGKMVSLNEYKDAKGFIVIFTCNHCPFAKAYEERILELDKNFANKGYPVIAVNPNDPTNHPEDSFENMVKRSKEKNYTFPYLVDETQDVAKRYGAAKTPHVYLLKKSGKNLKVEYIGAIDDNTESAADVKTKYVENAIADLEANREVAIKETKAIGCGIKWKK